MLLLNYHMMFIMSLVNSPTVLMVFDPDEPQYFEEP